MIIKYVSITTIVLLLSLYQPLSAIEQGQPTLGTSPITFTNQADSPVSVIVYQQRPNPNISLTLAPGQSQTIQIIPRHIQSIYAQRIMPELKRFMLKLFGYSSYIQTQLAPERVDPGQQFIIREAPTNGGIRITGEQAWV